MKGEKNMAGPMKQETSEFLAIYLNDLKSKDKKKLTYKEIGKRTGCVTETIRKIYEGKMVPAYPILKDILECYDIEEEKIKELADEDAVLLYKYWDFLYPEESSTSEMISVIREMMNEKGVSFREVVKSYGVSQSYVSAMLNGQIGVSYNCVKRFSKALNIETKDLIYKLKDRSEINERKREFTEFLISVREYNNWTIEDTAKLCGFIPAKYKRIEEADMDIEVATIVKIAKGIKIDLEELGRLAINAKILWNIEGFENAISNKKKIMLTKNNIGRHFEDFLLDLCKYDKISMASISYNSRAIVTLLIMILMGELKTTDKYKSEIIYYLSQIKKGNDSAIFLQYDNLGLFKDKNVVKDSTPTMSEVFERYKEAFGYSFLQISKIANISKGYISNKNQANDFGDLKFTSKVFPATNIPISMGIELIIRDRELERKKDALTEDVISVTKIINKLKNYPLWIFGDNKVDIEGIKEIFKIIYGTGDAVSKYEKLKRLPLPEKYY